MTTLEQQKQDLLRYGVIMWRGNKETLKGFESDIIVLHQDTAYRIKMVNGVTLEIEAKVN